MVPAIPMKSGMTGKNAVLIIGGTITVVMATGGPENTYPEGVPAVLVT